MDQANKNINSQQHSIYDKPPNVLVVGNGFDLHHGMNTRYSDFIIFAQKVFEESVKGNSEAIGELKYLLYGNPLFLLLVRSINDNRTWIDMELEIKCFIEKLLTFIQEFGNKQYRLTTDGKILFEKEQLDDFSWNLLNYLQCFFVGVPSHVNYVLKKDYMTALKQIDEEKVIEKLVEELEKLTKALAIYLSEFEPQERIPDLYLPDQTIQGLDFKYVISFNYTNTVEVLYKIRRENIYYYHGSLEQKNIVIGYENDQSVKDLAFQKYYRRVIRHTDEIDWNNFGINHLGTLKYGNVFFYGHSLNASDSSILLKLLDSRFRANIFIRSEKDYAEKIHNLILLLGKDNFEDKNNKSIFFLKTSDYH